MRKVLKNKPKTRTYLDNLPKIYMVGCWAKYGVRTFSFTGKYVVKDGVSIPLVYDYDDHNGTCDNYYLRRLDRTTTGQVIMWTQNEEVARRIAESLNKDKENTVKVEHTYVPLVTVNANFTMPKCRPLTEEQINEILAKRLGEETVKYADIECWEVTDMGVWEEQIMYRVTVRVAAEKRG